MSVASRFLVLALATSCSAQAATTDTFPSRPIRMVAAAAAGSGPDILARHVGAKLTESLGQQVVVDPRSGASGLIGAELVARSAPDGYTFWMATMTQLISTTLQGRLKLTQEFAPVGMVATTPYVIAASSTLPVQSIAELVDYARARPKQLLYGSAGEGSTPHMCMESFLRMTRLEVVHVPYKSSVPALTDLMGGQVHVTCVAAPAVQTFVKSGKVRALGVTSAARTPLAPGLAPVSEAVPGYELMGWYGVLAPRATPKHIIARMNAELGKALGSKDLQERLIASGAEAAPSTPEQLGAFLQRETQRWEKLLRESGMKKD